MSWREDLVQRFTERPELPMDELAQAFAIAVAEIDELERCLATFTEEYGIPLGKLRPTDELDPLFLAPPTRNPVSDAYRRFALGEAAGELIYMLKKRRKKIGRELTTAPQSIGEYVDAWFGRESQ